MSKFYGKVGYSMTEETSPGVWEGSITERPYYGDMISNGFRWDKGDGLNDDIRLKHRISIIADQYAYENFSAIRYVEVMGTKWNVTDIEQERPRLILTLGGVYNGN